MGAEAFTFAERLEQHSVDVQLGNMINGRLLVDTNFLMGASIDPKKGNRANLYITTGLLILPSKTVREDGGVITTKPARLSFSHPLVRVGNYRVIFFGRIGDEALLRIISNKIIETKTVPPQEDFNVFLANLQSTR